MKQLKSLFLITMLLGASVSMGQNYYPLVKSNSLYNCFDTYAGPPPHYSRLYRFSSTDTIIGVFHYNKLESSSDSLNYYSTDLFFREDTAAKRVYMLFDGNEGLLYDFSLSAGDTVTITNTYIGDSSHLVTIDSVDSILIGANYHRVLIYNLGYWIEGVGDIHGLYYPGLDVVGWSEILVCYYENDMFMWLNPDYPNCFFAYTGVEEESETILKLYPNPATTQIAIESDLQFDDFRIYNTTGQLVKSGLVNENNTIDVENLPSGLYFFSLDGEKQYRGRFIKD